MLAIRPSIESKTNIIFFLNDNIECRGVIRGRKTVWPDSTISERSWQRTLTYFVRGSIDVRLTSCLTGLDSAALLLFNNFLKSRTKEAKLLGDFWSYFEKHDFLGKIYFGIFLFQHLVTLMATSNILTAKEGKNRWMSFALYGHYFQLDIIVLPFNNGSSKVL